MATAKTASSDTTHTQISQSSQHHCHSLPDRRAQTIYWTINHFSLKCDWRKSYAFSIRASTTIYFHQWLIFQFFSIYHGVSEISEDVFKFPVNRNSKWSKKKAEPQWFILSSKWVQISKAESWYLIMFLLQTTLHISERLFFLNKDKFIVLQKASGKLKRTVRLLEILGFRLHRLYS